MVKRIAILGSTGSIGRNTLRVIDALGPAYQVVALSAHTSVELLAEQTKRYKPKLIAISNAACEKQLRNLVGGLDVKISAGPESLIETCTVGRRRYRSNCNRWRGGPAGCSRSGKER